jgi:hypothetical protein
MKKRLAINYVLIIAYLPCLKKEIKPELNITSEIVFRFSGNIGRTKKNADVQ